MLYFLLMPLIALILSSLIEELKTASSVIIAVTLAVKTGEKEVCFMFIGVYKSYRVFGLTKAIKALAINKLKELNYVKISTNNNLENKPILAVNKALGFEVVREHIDYRRICEKLNM
jgi:RimJ/RimL family protein N-acetyltransferase